MIKRKNKLTLKTKAVAKELCVIAAIIGLLSIDNNMAYHDSIVQHHYNCSFATYAADNAKECK